MVDNLKFDLLNDIAIKNNYTWLQQSNKPQNNGFTIPLSFNNTNTPVSENSLTYVQRKLPAQVQIDISNIPQQVEVKDASKPFMLGADAEIDWENFSISNVPVDNRRIDKDKGYRKQVKNALVQQFMQNGTTSNPTPMSEKDAKKLADRYIENMRNQANFMGTITYIDKDAYNQAKKDRKATYNDLVKQYRAEGMSKGDAKRKADYMLARVERVKNDDALRIINDPEYKDLFMDENGQFSSTRLKQFTLGLANTHTGTEEVTNYHLSLKERREMAAKMGWDDDALCELAHRAGLDFEKDYTEVLQIATAVGTTALGAGIGTLFNRSYIAGASASANSSAGASRGIQAGANAAGSAAAGAKVHSLDGTQNGAAIGAGVGALITPYIKDPGSKEPDVVAPAEPKKVEPQIEEQQQQQNEQTQDETICVLEPEDLPVPPTEVPEDTCTYKLKRGQILYDAVKHGYGLTNHKEIMKYVHEIKDRYGIAYNVYTNRTEWEMPEINGKKFNCDVEFEGTCKNYAKKGTKSQNGTFTPRTTKRNNDPIYTTVDCDGNRKQYNSKAERDAAVAASQPK